MKIQNSSHGQLHTFKILLQQRKVDTYNYKQVVSWDTSKLGHLLYSILILVQYAFVCSLGMCLTHLFIVGITPRPPPPKCY